MPGDVIRFRAGSEQHGIPRDSSGTVVAVAASRNQLTIRKADGEEVSYNPALLKPATRAEHGYCEERREVASGERIQFTASDKQLGVRAREFGTLEKIADNNTLTVRTDRGQTIELDPARARHIEHG